MNKIFHQCLVYISNIFNYYLIYIKNLSSILVTCRIYEPTLHFIVLYKTKDKIVLIHLDSTLQACAK